MLNCRNSGLWLPPAHGHGSAEDVYNSGRDQVTGSVTFVCLSEHIVFVICYDTSRCALVKWLKWILKPSKTNHRCGQWLWRVLYVTVAMRHRGLCYLWTFNISWTLKCLEPNTHSSVSHFQDDSIWAAVQRFYVWLSYACQCVSNSIIWILIMLNIHDNCELWLTLNFWQPLNFGMPHTWHGCFHFPFQRLTHLLYPVLFSA